jgi:hypothetical protein
VTLRCLTPVATIGLILAFGAGVSPGDARAATLNPNSSPATTTVDYRLSSTTSIPVPDANIQGPQVVALISPAGGVVPPTLDNGKQGSPLTILPDSHGFDPNNLLVFLLDGTSASGQPEQKFGLIFGGQGLQPGGVLHFALSIDKSLASNPPVLQSQTTGISIVADQPTTLPPSSTEGGSTNGAGGGGSTSGGNQVPEPLSLVLWSAAAVGIATRHRRARHHQPA